MESKQESELSVHTMQTLTANIMLLYNQTLEIYIARLTYNLRLREVNQPRPNQQTRPSQITSLPAIVHARGNLIQS